MSIKTITVFLDASAASEARLQTAIGLARARGAHLVAVALTRQIDFGVYAAPGAGMAVDLAQIDESRAEARALADHAAEIITAAGLSADTRWAASIAVGLEDTAALAARHSDLSVIGPVGGDGPEAATADSVFEGALFGSGRPVLIVPHGWKGERIGRKVMVCWDGSRVAARAVADALPFLASAESVMVAIVDPKPGEDGIGEQPGADIAAVIARHGVKVEINLLPRAGASVAERLMTAATDAECDLMVMGAYGHSRLPRRCSPAAGGCSRGRWCRCRVPLDADRRGRRGDRPPSARVGFASARGGGWRAPGAGGGRGARPGSDGDGVARLASLQVHVERRRRHPGQRAGAGDEGDPPVAHRHQPVGPAAPAAPAGPPPSRRALRSARRLGQIDRAVAHQAFDHVAAQPVLGAQRQALGDRQHGRIEHRARPGAGLGDVLHEARSASARWRWRRRPISVSAVSVV
jgi:nucleotide-binding universal stress UspA family protein